MWDAEPIYNSPLAALISNGEKTQPAIETMSASAAFPLKNRYMMNAKNANPKTTLMILSIFYLPDLLA
ncbi:hypothetical protein RKH46_004602 [Vibrio parahaemolyticus]|nr:hypothetical protein [Vibrio parahaemolyticus]